MDLTQDQQHARLLRAFGIIIPLHEGGFQKDPNDPGNYHDGKLIGTKFGISARGFPNEDIPNLTLVRAEELYIGVWGHCVWLNDDRVLLKFADLEINMQWGDRGHATEVLQEAINSVMGHAVISVDRDFGQATSSAANSCDPDKLIPSMCNCALDYYKKIEVGPEAKFAPGWNKRAMWVPQPVSLLKPVE